jgi:hypothetical protein
LSSSCSASETEPMPNSVSMAAEFSRWNPKRIIELREFPTDLDPNDASLTRAAGRGSGAKRVGSAGRGVSRGPWVAPRFAEGAARGWRRGKAIARRNCLAGGHYARRHRPSRTPELRSGTAHFPPNLRRTFARPTHACAHRAVRRFALRGLALRQTHGLHGVLNFFQRS